MQFVPIEYDKSVGTVRELSGFETPKLGVSTKAVTKQMEKIMQHTIKRPHKVSGIGLHSGGPVSMQLIPAPVNNGIVFRRIDFSKPIDIRVTPEKMQETLMCSTLVQDDIKIGTIEHLMAALAAFQIDNIIIEIDNAEVPVLDGSSAPFMFVLRSIGVELQEAPRRILKVKEKVRLEEDGRIVELSPRKEDGFFLKVSTSFDHPVIANTNQEMELLLNQEIFDKAVARARTFGYVKDLERLHQNNLAKGASLENAIGITDDGVMNEGGLRFPDEFIRHKMLDAIGDLYTIGPIQGDFTAHNGGHALHHRLLKKLLSTAGGFEWVSDK